MQCFDSVEFVWTLVQTQRVLVRVCYLISWKSPELNVTYLVKVWVLITGSKCGFLHWFVFPWSYEGMPFFSNLQITSTSVVYKISILGDFWNLMGTRPWATSCNVEVNSPTLSKRSDQRLLEVSSNLSVSVILCG